MNEATSWDFEKWEHGDFRVVGTDGLASKETTI